MNISIKQNSFLTGSVRFFYCLVAVPAFVLTVLSGLLILIGKILEKIWSLTVRMLSEAGDAVFASRQKNATSQTEEENSGSGNENKPEPENHFARNLIIVLLIILAIVWSWRSCQNRNEPLPVVTEIESPEKIYERAFDDVVIARAYLDGVQTEVDAKCPRALVGFKFINDKPVKDYDFEGKTYEEAVKIVAEDWKPLVVGSLNKDVRLSEQQMAVVTLAAMRMGKNGFLRSTFLKKLNEGVAEDAGLWLLLQTPNGEIRKTGEEPLQYFYVLRLLWEHKVEIRELLDMPMFSYRNIKVKALYTDVQPEYGKEEEHLLAEGDFPTPREALGLD